MKEPVQMVQQRFFYEEISSLSQSDDRSFIIDPIPHNNVFILRFNRT